MSDNKIIIIDLEDISNITTIDSFKKSNKQFTLTLTKGKDNCFYITYNNEYYCYYLVNQDLKKNQQKERDIQNVFPFYER